VIHVSHRLTEIFGIADSYTVFRDGAYVADGAISDVSKSDLIRMIVSRPLTEEFIKENRAHGAPVEGPLGDRTIGVGLDRLRQVRTRRLSGAAMRASS